MKTIRHTSRMILGVVLGLVIVAGAASALATAARPAGMSAAEYRALMLRSQALNELYKTSTPAGPAAETLRADRIRGEELNRLYGDALTRMTPSEFRGVYLRNSWLNENARTVWPVSTPTAVPSVVTVGDGFDWGDAAIGAGLVGGLTLLGAGGAVAVRRHGRLIHLPH
jgi:hypothetical protein